jgi:hypothetical protein
MDLESSRFMEEERKKISMSFPELGMIAGTRVLLGYGIGLLVGEHLSTERRRAIGWTLVLVGAFSTIPLGLEVLGSRNLEKKEKQAADVLAQEVA